ncbi:hypothetical protein [Desulfobulbus sp.]|uniref:hypothetical protein n=1 Tax=Desulfobulbus sp. TaxID=895 RepID=UPI0027BB091F|nr:hypothetical protein [Desulfobulbus sp.]
MKNTSDSLPEISSMKDALMQQRATLSPESAARRHKDAAEDFSAGICPHCGGGLSFDKDVMDKDSREVIAPECPACNWKRYAARVGESADRHGLV